jgi:glutamate synthase domain-containing protein 2/glutamate synthase domain-containing protein 1/glutamate synthase domain-containing protein 3
MTATSEQIREAKEKGLYRPETEHDACGVGFVANIKGLRSHSIVEQALKVLANMEHRGACGCDPLTSDGAGILFQLPYGFFAEEAKKLSFKLPRPGQYGVGMLFLPADGDKRDAVVQLVERIVRKEGLNFIAWRDVPVDVTKAGPLAKKSMPVIRQMFVCPAEGDDVHEQRELERRLYVLRKRIEQVAREQGLYGQGGVYVCSLSSRTIVYKGLLLPETTRTFFLDLMDESVESAIAVVHSRFSTNTFPTWERSHPYRLIAHNGEINTLRGNVNWMHAREKALESPLFGDDVDKLMPVIDEHGSDSAMFDNALEFLLQTGRDLPHAMMMMIPEAWQKHESMSEDERAFYRYHACLMEPWDGPASMAFTDGRVVGACLDRNGLRPSRYYVTHDDMVVMASEAGVLDIEPKNVKFKNRLQPGRMFLVDTEAGRIIDDRELKQKMAARKPYAQWLKEHLLTLEDLREGFGRRNSSFPPAGPVLTSGQRRLRDLQVHGYSMEDLDVLLAPMAQNGEEPTGSMGNDTPLAVLSDRPQLLFQYFKQLFAQVTNPPIDPIREELVMSLKTYLGAQRNLFGETPMHCRQIELDHPVLTNDELEKLRGLEDDYCDIRSCTLNATFPVPKGGEGLARALDKLCRDASDAIDDGVSVIIISDRGHNERMAPIPSLLAVAAVHHHLVREGTRNKCGLVIESGEPREIHHFCLLMGYGASAVNPYLAYEAIDHLIEQGTVKLPRDKAIYNYKKAVGKGLLKVMSKMGISTLQSYQGAQIFEAIGLKKDFVDRYFTWTPTRIEGVGMNIIAEEAKRRHDDGFKVNLHLFDPLDPGGQYKWRRRGERHQYNAETVPALQHSVRAGSYKMWKAYSALVKEEDTRLFNIRGLLKFTEGTPIPLEEVEPATEIVKRFKTGAMSFGSISREAHENLAIAMNRLGGRSNTGEGGEDPARYTPDANGDLRRSSIKQVASGRFGVTSHYLVNADELQIKMAQGAKPGEGGQLPGHKVDDLIAKLRYSTPGVGLISPPPHHDIYSIEDLAQLIHDLKNSNDRARISVKLVSEVGVGTVAAGVSKAKAELVLISGDSGGTGASPLTSIKHAGLPWELGLAETQQVLVLNDLRGRIRVETDGGLRTGRDVAIAALLGAEEFGFATSALVASGCILMRVCHLNTCPVGVATQDPKLREKFSGKPEHVINMMMFIAEELREIMAELGFRTVDEMIGRVEMLEQDRTIDHWKAKDLDLSTLLYKPDVGPNVPVRCVGEQDHNLSIKLDHKLIEAAKPALEHKQKVQIALPIRNIDRTACTMLSAEVSRKHGLEGLPEDTIHINFEGSAGNSFAAFLAPGISIELEGDANDYFGKGLSGGRIAIYPPRDSSFVPEENIVIGNVSLYGATSGEVYVRGRAGERFGVRNSGAVAVVEGVGDHGCEYMTRGTVVVLGPTGRNFAAGMSGGVAYVLDSEGLFRTNVNTQSVELEALDTEDKLTVRALIEKHIRLTGSEHAKRILENFEREAKHFIKVMPTDYKRVLSEKKLRHVVQVPELRAQAAV